MKAVKVIGVLFFVYAIITIIGMVLDNNSFWMVYNIVTLVFSIPSGIVLLKQK
ncbi:MAG: hypothetical protein WC412_02020 [Candidatus Omnitrophota bacterium]|jgi:hypothetical protein